MAAIWEALVDGEKMRLDDDGTLYLLQVFGVGLPPARRLKVRSPQQHGSTDIGFRYDEREMRLGFFFNANSTVAAVAKRDEIYAFWRSLADTPIQLRYTREDNSVRQIDCHVVGVVDMPWNPDENQNGLQNFVVQVEAANPLWYDPTEDVVSFTSADNLDWWLALGTIAAENVEDHVESPTQGQSVSDSVAIADYSPFTVFFRTNVTTLTPASPEVVFDFYNTSGAHSIYGYLSNVPENFFWFYYDKFISNAFLTGEQSYFVSSSGSIKEIYRNLETVPVGAVSAVAGIDGTPAESKWRSDAAGTNSWTPTLPYAAIYNIELTPTQREALVIAVDGGLGASKTITYGGSFLTYPVVTITGPITDPILTNVSTGEDLDFTGITIASGDTYTIDCRFGYKTVKNAAGTNKIADLTAASDLVSFHLGADPEVSGGANAFTLTGTGTDANTEVTITYNERFVGA